MRGEQVNETPGQVEPQVMVSIESLSKAFGGVHALQDVSLSVRFGAVHGLVGANGAGKSTLIRCLAGVTQPDSGQIVVNGQVATIASPHDASALGMAFIHQELSLVPGWSVLRNMALGIPPTTRLGLIDWRPIRERARAVAERVGIEFSLNKLVDDLSTADRWLVMIGRALMHDAQLIAMDEPTASLSAGEAERLHAIVRDLVTQGKAIIFVSHRLDEVSTLCSDITVFKDGAVVRQTTRASTSRAELVRAIVGQDIDVTSRPVGKPTMGDVVLDVRDVHDAKTLHGVSLQVRAGEVVGLGGLVGAGRTELARIIFGAAKRTSGQVVLAGSEVHYATPADAVRSGIGMVPEERRSEGVFLDRSIDFNINIAAIDSLRVHRLLPLLRLREAQRRAQVAADGVTVKAKDVRQLVGALSGGNQQKVAIARWLIDKPRLLILDEPSRGVDVGARAEVHRLVRELAAQGTAVLAISSDNEELVSLCDRVVVMAEGTITGELTGEDITIDHILSLSFAHDREKVAAT
jgi:ribose transport system ATP-binding protein